jgi:hypothetical protein
MLELFLSVVFGLTVYLLLFSVITLCRSKLILQTHFIRRLKYQGILVCEFVVINFYRTDRKTFRVRKIIRISMQLSLFHAPPAR